jgi:coatomer protein complex subunit epsilon
MYHPDGEEGWADARYRTLQITSPNHIFLTDLQQKSELFDKAAAKYSPKVDA